jgi:ribosome-binding factor A
MGKGFSRMDRVEQLAREVLGEAIQELKDPRVGFVTVTSVKVSPDLRNAQVYVSIFGNDEEREETLAAVRHAAPHLRSVMGSQVRLKNLPRLEILEDLTAAHGERIEALLREVGVSKGPEAPETSDVDESLSDPEDA